MINRNRLLNDFFKLLKIKCSTHDERQVADLLKKELQDLGLEVTEDDTGAKIGGNCGNVFACLKGSVNNVPVLMFAAHMDCVEPCANIDPQCKDGVITSAGDTILGADDKAGIAPIMEALRVLKEQNLPHGDIQVVFTVAEEGGLNGSKNMDKSLLKADMGFVLDSSGKTGNIVVSAPGQNRLEVTIHGKKAHAGLAPEQGINAIVVASKALAQMRLGRIDDETTANIGIFEGGTATNIVPDKVKVICEARSRNVKKLETQTAHMKEVFEKVAAAEGATAEVVIKELYSPYTLPENLPVIQLAQTAIASIGLTPLLEATGGGSDANFYNSYGVPSAVLSNGMQKAHTTDEYMEEDDLYRNAEIVLAIIKHAAQ